MMTQAQKDKAAEAQERFWNTPGVRREYSYWVKAYGPKQGAGVFWGLQQTLDIKREVFKGKPLTQEDIDQAHEQALRWNALWDEDEALFWEVWNYESCITNRWVPEQDVHLELHPRAGNRYGKKKGGGVGPWNGEESMSATNRAVKRYQDQQREFYRTHGADAIPF